MPGPEWTMVNDPDTAPAAWRFRRLDIRSLQGLDARVAMGPLSRLLGLAFLDRSQSPDALLIPRCRSVHTFGMRFPLDLFFLDADDQPLVAVRDVSAGHRVRVPKARSVLEIPSGDDRVKTRAACVCPVRGVK